MPARKKSVSSRKKPATKRLRVRKLMRRVPAPVAKSATRSTRAAAEPDIPEVVIRRTGGTVSIEIAFGHAQHGTYTIQLFDPTGKNELAREAGVSTDEKPDRFDLALTPAQLDRHMLQWSGFVDAFSSAPGQRYSVTFDVIQGGEVVPGGRCVKSGPLDTTQGFLGLLRLVTS
jgi:hypothetical protein